MLSSDEALYHIEGAMGNLQVFRELSVVVGGSDSESASTPASGRVASGAAIG
jgi:hypothetical protein